MQRNSYGAYGILTGLRNFPNGKGETAARQRKGGNQAKATQSDMPLGRQFVTGQWDIAH